MDTETPRPKFFLIIICTAINNNILKYLLILFSFTFLYVPEEVNRDEFSLRKSYAISISARSFQNNYRGKCEDESGYPTGNSRETFTAFTEELQVIYTEQILKDRAPPEQTL